MDLTSKNGATVSVSDHVFDVPYNEALVHQVVHAYLAGGRAGTKAQKNRAAVSGGGAKPYRQKGTGRARAGTTRGPIWRSGGKTFAASPRSYEQKVNRKMYRGAMRSIMAELVRQGRLVIADLPKLDSPKTKAVRAALDGLGVADGLLVSAEADATMALSTRNLVGVECVTVSALDPVSLLRFNHIVMDETALQRIEDRLS